MPPSLFSCITTFDSFSIINQILTSFINKTKIQTQICTLLLKSSRKSSLIFEHFNMKDISNNLIKDMKQIFALALLLLAVSCRQCPQADYDFNLLTLSWLGEFCTETQCIPNWQHHWKGDIVTIHGFWPSWSKKYPGDCESRWRKKGDQACMHNAYMKKLDVDEYFKHDQKLLDELAHYWPSLKNKYPLDWFYDHEWQHHGTCYLRNMIADNLGEYQKDQAGFNATILKNYFVSVIDRVKNLGIKLVPGKTYHSKAQFAKDIGLEGKEDYFYVNCKGDKELDEILICYTRSSTVGGQELRVCPSMYKDCHPPFTAKNPSGGEL